MYSVFPQHASVYKGTGLGDKKCDTASHQLTVYDFFKFFFFNCLNSTPHPNKIVCISSDGVAIIRLYFVYFYVSQPERAFSMFNLECFCRLTADRNVALLQLQAISVMAIGA